MGRRILTRAAVGATLFAILMLLTSTTTYASNCSSLDDCFFTIDAGVIVVVGLLVLLAVALIAAPILLEAAAAAEVVATGVEAEAAVAVESAVAEAAAEGAAEVAAEGAAEVAAEGTAEVAAEGAAEVAAESAPEAAAEAEAEAEAAAEASRDTLSNQTARNYAERMQNAIDDHLTSDDLQGAWRDVHGDPVPDPNNPGEFYDHVGEVNDAMRSLRNATEEFKDLLNDPSLSSADRSIIQNLLSRASKTLDYVEKVITRDQWFPGTKIPPS